jgi:uncharacterized protein YxjI
MGCLESKDRKMMEDGGMKAEDAIIGRVTTKETEFRIKEKFWSWTGRDFCVKDNSGDPWVKVVGAAWSIRDKMVLVDAKTDEPVLILQRKIFSFGNQFQIFTFKPNKPGQESTETHDGTPVYRFSKIQANWGTSYTYTRYDGNDDGPPFWTAEIPFGWKFQMNLVPAKNDDVLVAEIDQEGYMQYESENTYTIVCAKGIDPLEVIAICVILDEIRDDQKKD